MKWAVFYSANCCQVFPVEEKNIQANAISGKFPNDHHGLAKGHLIAAAPELLAEANNILMHSRQGDLHPKDLQRLQIAVDQATGNTP